MSKGDLENWDFFAPVLSTDKENLPKTQQAPVTDKTTEKTPKQKRPKKQKDPLPARKIPETQEEIDAWIAERKKRFPTQQRIAEKAKMEQDREARGALDLSEQANKERRRKEKVKDNTPIIMSSKNPERVKSMIDRLMEDEERKQRSIVLQCFRYFVSHNFLQDWPQQGPE